MLTCISDRWKCFQCGAVNLSSGAGGQPDRGDGLEGGGGGKPPQDRPSEILIGTFVLRDAPAIGVTTIERLQCTSDSLRSDKSDELSVREGGVMVTRM